MLINLYRANICHYAQIRYQTQPGVEKLRFETSADWLSYFREICLETVAQETLKLIGGQGLAVEIDEYKFGKKVQQGQTH